MKVASVSQNNPFFSRGGTEHIQDAEKITEDFDLVVLWGGADIATKIYNHNPVGTKTGPAIPTNRDELEMDCILKAQEYNIPILGICRGAQLLCAYGGGELFQDVNNHAGTKHVIEDYRGREVIANSTHHQAMIPAEHHMVVAWTKERMTTTRLYGGYRHNVSEIPEVEVLYLPEFNALAVQGHPEFVANQHPFALYVRELMKEFLEL